MKADLYEVARGILKGYERRKKEYYQKFSDLHDPLKSSQTDKFQSVGKSGSQPENAVISVEKLEDSSLAKYVHAVDFAKNMLFDAYKSEKTSEKLFNAIKYNAEDRFRYTYAILEKTMGLHISRRTFFRRKEEFFNCIISFLKIE